MFECMVGGSAVGVLHSLFCGRREVSTVYNEGIAPCADGIGTQSAWLYGGVHINVSNLLQHSECMLIRDGPCSNMIVGAESIQEIVKILFEVPRLPPVQICDGGRMW